MNKSKKGKIEDLLYPSLKKVMDAYEVLNGNYSNDQTIDGTCIELKTPDKAFLTLEA